ncbi:MAG TPA: DNA-processing protein DprA [Anaerolineaceae bacterium]
MNLDPRLYWIGFNLARGIGAVRMRALLDFFGNLEVAWNAPYEAYLSAGLPEKLAQRLVHNRKEVDLERVYEQITRLGIQVLTWEDIDYPKHLREINQPPPVIYLRGAFKPEDDWAIALVGTRRVTVYGRQVTEQIASALVKNGLTVVSGLARGTDAIAHEIALKEGGRTIAVLGSGIDRIYPPENTNLAKRIAENGAVISDYAPGTPPDSVNFPPRNRIISGLSLATIVVEAGETSGALITSTFAAEQGREVFAVPGSILAPQSRGTNRLIQQGAHPYLDVKDVLEVLHLTKAQEQRSAQQLLPVDEVENCLLNLLGDEPVHVDELCVQSGLSIDRVSATLALLELKGYARSAGGMNYVIAREAPKEYSVHGDL